ncbi:exodeoxyribonuclease VII large subunit [Helicobacter mustelae]|uniref:Exodeoxyribonuclease 7 large subunit n=1 Tax=Helicobacter mustelae (strain ATCC 43772 / CCUG 25715 / CIP 103759 / LMG 18044 / NCTC 12198 / R85-136P) TaxID=679897 RepID=D3UGU6_HELM1|nr:exodeoxyribonuclease VII large subunit [Helicobacter mustelae]CBG39717.1 exodeoxyribonuclease VII large subunit [Helicobacter mustelae 12198]SQH71223.1 exodeoxyribonuclease VII large subunit [Helicobacter mustelae]STP12351.1 exodeoxyribonuclease VII large subunit [Helicobacter mustelae]
MANPLSVSALNAQIQALLETTFLQVCVEGEISNLTKHNSGHFYFSIKDQDSVISCVLFRGNAQKLRFVLENAQKVIVQGSISVYVPRGNYQILCTNITPFGQGALHLAYEQLRKKYEKLGYFDAALKKKMPKFPKKIALITSNTGAALQDMLSVAKKRWNLVKLVNFDTLVQGDEAKFQIADRIAYVDGFFGSSDAFDVMIIGRGGGSMEDLWAFNEEIVMQAIFEARTPIVSAVGHEIDVVLSDFVADLRAPTPSAAMEMILPEKHHWLLVLDEMGEEISLKMQKYLAQMQDRLSDYEYFLQQCNVGGRIHLAEEILQNLLVSLKQAARIFFDCRANLLATEGQMAMAMEKFLQDKKLELLKWERLLRCEREKDRAIQISHDGRKVDLQNLVIGDLIEIFDDQGFVSAQITQDFTKL